MSLHQCSKCYTVYDLPKDENPPCPQCGHVKGQLGAQPRPDPQSVVIEPQVIYQEKIIRAPSEWEAGWKSNPIAAFIASTKAVLLDPQGFFERVSPTRDHFGINIYVLITYVISSIPGALFGLVVNSLFSAGTKNPAASIAGQMASTFLVLGVGLAITPIALYLFSAIVHFIFTNVGGSEKEFNTSLTLMTYVSSARLFSVVPLLGVLVTAVYSIVLMILGGAKIHEISTGKAALCVVLNLCICCCLMLLMYLLFASVFLAIMTLIGVASS